MSRMDSREGGRGARGPDSSRNARGPDTATGPGSRAGTRYGSGSAEHPTATGGRGGRPGGRPGHRHTAERPRPRRAGHHPVLVALAAALVVVVLAAGGTLLWARAQISPGKRPGRDVTVSIPKGASTARIGRILAKAGVIHAPGLFALYVRLEGLGALYPGTYHLPTHESYDAAVRRLQTAPTVAVDTLVIPEGFTLAQIAERVAALPGMHLSAATFLALSSSGDVRSPFEPAGVDNLEGLVFPATYPIPRTDSATDVMDILVQTFDQHAYSLGLPQAAAALHESTYSLVRVASIVQGEAKLTSQFPDVASVLYNRLAEGIPLGADSTLVYALRRQDPNVNVSRIDYQQPSPYNTRLHKGLPPTPIDSPGVSALTAAAHPPKTDLQYFVEIDPDGRLGFASSAAGFDQLVATCRAHGLC